MRRYIMAILSITLTLCFFLCGVPAVLAREADIDEFTLEEIIVTAEKREVDVQDTTIAITAVTGADIRDRALINIDNVLSNIPSVEVQGSAQGMQVFIRGIGSYVDPNMQDPSSALMLDGVYSGRTEGLQGSLFDISRVEVLRGPQGTMYGRNALGGSINIVSNSPTDEFEGSGTVMLGDYNLKHFDGALNVPIISEKLSGRLAFLRETRDGYLTNGALNADKFSFRAKISYKPTETLSFLATLERSEDNWRGPATVPVPGSAGNLPDLPIWVDEFDYTAGWEIPPEVGYTPWSTDEWHPPGTQNMRQMVYTLQVDWDMNWGVLTLLPSYTRNWRYMQGEMTYGDSSNFGTTEGRPMYGEQKTGEARLASPADSPFKWLVGYYVQINPLISTRTYQNPSTYDDDSWHYVTYPRDAETYAWFGQATYPVTDRFRVTGGLRYSYDDKSTTYAFGNSNVDPSDPLYADAVDGVYYSGILDYINEIKSTTYKAGIEYDLFEDSMLYAQVSTGFKAGGLNNTTPPTQFDPEELIAYEIGSKNRFLDDRLQLNIAAYAYDYDNMQVPYMGNAIVSDITGEVSYAMFILNADSKGTSRGGEIELDYLLTPGDRLKGSLAYMDTEYGDATLPANADWGLMEDYPVGGATMANSPKLSGSIGYEHSWFLDNGGEVSASFNTRMSQGYYVTIERWVTGSWQEGFHRSDAYITYRAGNGNWLISAWSKNLENDAQTTMVWPAYRKTITDPRTVGVTFSINY